jgi:hypothetical protein
MRDKDSAGILELFERAGLRPVYYNLRDSRARNIIPDEFPCVAAVIDSVDELGRFIGESPEANSLVVLCGSFRLYAIAREVLRSACGNAETS